MPLKFTLGEAFQFDWSEEWLEIGGIHRKVLAAYTKLCASRAFMLSGYPSQSHEMLFDAHTRAFTAFGGIPKRGMPDYYVPGNIIVVMWRSPLCGPHCRTPTKCGDSSNMGNIIFKVIVAISSDLHPAAISVLRGIPPQFWWAASRQSTQLDPVDRCRFDIVTFKHDNLHSLKESGDLFCAYFKPLCYLNRVCRQVRQGIGNAEGT